MVICDWLDVTYSPIDMPDADLRTMLLASDFSVEYDKGQRLQYRASTGGTVGIQRSARFGRISLSGSACAALRDAGLWADVLFLLGSSPHKVTRIDGALDVRTDPADVIASLCMRYPDGQVRLNQRPLNVTRFLEARPFDGRDSGTYYVGYRSRGRVTARVYDKRLEHFKRTGVDLGYNLTRYEITVRADYGATLRDAYDPTALFWHVASPALVSRRPDDVGEWVSGSDFTGWSHVPRTYVPYEVMQRRVEYMAELEALGLLADDVGDYGRHTLLLLIAKRLGIPEAVQSVSDLDDAASA